MRTAIPRASRSPMLRWPRSPSSVTRFTASGTTPSHPTSSQLEAVIPRHALRLPRGGLHDIEAALARLAVLDPEVGSEQCRSLQQARCPVGLHHRPVLVLAEQSGGDT